MNKYIRKFNKKTEHKLRNLQSKKPKEYWKILNSIKNKKQHKTPEIQELFNFFKDSFTAEYDTDDENISLNTNPDENNQYLNSAITSAEIEKCISALKNSKSPGTDNILNEYIKNTKEMFLPLYVKLFNAILDTGLIPSTWIEGMIVPIYKNKGDETNAENYRLITLISCFGKLFTAVLNNRLNSYLEDNGLLNENQAGFRHGYSTTDHIFTLHCLIELLKHQKKKLFCTFIDFSKAFDSVWRIGLWKKLLDTKINGKFFNVIHNLYHNIKSCILLNNEKSSFFSSNCGVRQGENLSPVLFALFLNDLEHYLRKRHNNGVLINFDSEDFYIFFKLIVLLYADDTIIVAEDAESLQKCLDDFATYCNEWKLNINVDKSKVVVFGSRNNKAFNFKLGAHTLEIVDNYKYLGVYFAKSGSFLTARKHIAAQARKALYLLYSRINNLNLPVDLQLKLFDSTVLPILTYGCEIWGFENLEILERIHAEFLRNITKARKSTPHYMLYAELGRYPLDITIKSRMIGFWNRMVTGNDSKLSYLLYITVKNVPYLESKWINHVKNTFNSAGRYDLWLSQNNLTCNNASRIIKQTLIDQNFQIWHSKLQNSSKGLNYRIFKENVQLEPYLTLLQPLHYIPLAKFRTGNHNFPVEILRWSGIPLDERKCTLCEANDIGDEYHYLLQCKYFTASRQRYIHKYYISRPNILKYKELLSIRSVTKLKKLSTFIKLLIDHFKRQ